MWIGKLFKIWKEACENRYGSVRTAHVLWDYVDYGSLIIELKRLSIYSAS